MPCVNSIHYGFAYRKNTPLDFVLVCLSTLMISLLPLTRSDFPRGLSSIASSRKWSGHVTVLATPVVMSCLTATGLLQQDCMGPQSIPYSYFIAWMWMHQSLTKRNCTAGITLISVCATIPVTSRTEGWSIFHLKDFNITTNQSKRIKCLWEFCPWSPEQKALSRAVLWKLRKLAHPLATLNSR